ncbi:MAG: Permease of the drug/metabolite transporter superfamily [Deltaproteobacteria bacterium]|nr:Permease of the drug/metabolite transporter superfamily [Deltaproteobacteria bacterium]
MNLSSKFDRNTLAGFAAILLWSTTIAFVRSLSEQVGGLTTAAAVYLIGGLFCLLRLGWRGDAIKTFRKIPLRYLFGCGALFVFYMLILYLAVAMAKSRQQVLEVGLLNYLWPSLTIVFSLFILDKKAGPLFFPGAFLAVVGIFFVIGQEVSISWTSFTENFAGNPFAYSLGLLAAIFWALYSNLTRRWAEGGSGAVELFIPATGVLLLIFRLFNPEVSSWTVRAGLEAVFLGIVTVVAYIFWDRAMRKGDVVLVAAFSYLTPLFSTIVSCLYLGISAGISLWIGCAMIIAGSILSWLSISEQRTESSK